MEFQDLFNIKLPNGHINDKGLEALKNEGNDEAKNCNGKKSELCSLRKQSFLIGFLCDWHERMVVGIVRMRPIALLQFVDAHNSGVPVHLNVCPKDYVQSGTHSFGYRKDEADCAMQSSREKFRCESKRKCLRKEWLCNRISNCEGKLRWNEQILRNFRCDQNYDD